jgi:hypothetical protein
MKEDEINFEEEIPYIPPIKPDTEIKEINNKHSLKKMRRIKMSELNLHGIENLKKVSLAITNLIKAGMDSYADDGKITWKDIGHFIKIAPSVISAIPALTQVKAELKDIKADQLVELKNSILPNIEIKNEYDKQFVDMSIDTLHLISKLVTNRIERSKEKQEIENAK